MKVAIDGPAGAGKTYIAKAVAKNLDFVYVDTGALYRGIGLFMLRNGVEPDNKEAVLPLLPQIKEEIRHENGEQRVFLNGEDITGLIRTEEISKAASDVSAIAEVRAFLYRTQRDIAENNNVVMDGRDIGTVILPDAELKLFMTASPEVRAKRRKAQLAEKGIDASYEEILADIIQRDYNDSHREASPLKMAEDGVLIDNSEMSIEENIEKVEELIKARWK